MWLGHLSQLVKVVGVAVGSEERRGGEDRFALELSEVAIIVIGLSGLPAPEEDAGPFERQCSNGGMVVVSRTTLASLTLRFGAVRIHH